MVLDLGRSARALMGALQHGFAVASTPYFRLDCCLYTFLNRFHPSNASKLCHSSERDFHITKDIYPEPCCLNEHSRQTHQTPPFYCTVHMFLQHAAAITYVDVCLLISNVFLSFFLSFFLRKIGK